MPDPRGPLRRPEAPASIPSAAAASWLAQAAAALTDIGISVAAGLGLGWALKTGGRSADDVNAAVGLGAIGTYLVVVVGVGSITSGRSVGKLIGGLRTVRLDGAPIGLPGTFVRDVLTRLLWLIPIFFIADCAWAFGRERRTLRDRIVATRVVEEPGARRRAGVLALATVASLGAAAGIAAASGYDGRTTYTRREFVADCADAPSARRSCGCLYDRLRRAEGQAWLDELSHRLSSDAGLSAAERDAYATAAVGCS